MKYIDCNNSSYIFLAKTNYHFLCSLAIIYAYRLEHRAVIYAQNINPEMNDICDCISELGLQVIRNPKRKSKIELFFIVAKDKKLLRDVFKSSSKVSLINFHWNVEHVFYDATYCYKNSDEVIFIEDGVNSYVNNTGSHIYKKLKRLLGVHFDFVLDEKLKAIYVTQPGKYPDSYKQKIKKFDLETIWNMCSEADKQRILSCFISSDVLNQISVMKGAGIIYTQPLSEDGFIKENEKIALYKKIYNYYSKYGDIILKPHPRDCSNYSDLGCLVFDSNWPSEILHLLNIHFTFAIGICTSAVVTTDADIKLNLNDNFLYDKKVSLIPLDKRAVS